MKICNRTYQENHMMTIKVIDGVECCPACGKPTFCHGLSAPSRALFWALGDDTGTSSKALARHMTGAPAGRFSHPPADASDRARCIRLLELIPAWIERLPEMVKYDRAEDPGVLTINSSGIHAGLSDTWKQQIPLIMAEGKF